MDAYAWGMVKKHFFIVEEIYWAWVHAQSTQIHKVKRTCNIEPNYMLKKKMTLVLRNSTTYILSWSLENAKRYIFRSQDNMFNEMMKCARHNCKIVLTLFCLFLISSSSVLICLYFSKLTFLNSRVLNFLRQGRGFEIRSTIYLSNIVIN
jgi:hypothetical protein